MNVHRSTRAHRARVAVIGAAALGGAILPAVGLGANSALAAGPCSLAVTTVTCTFTSSQSFTLPTGVTSATVTADGAAGAGNLLADPAYGGETIATLTGGSLSGATLAIGVGTTATGQTGGGDAGAGGGNGGSSNAPSATGGGGGGATTVALNSFSAANLLVEAGGGGGAAALYEGGNGGGGSHKAGYLASGPTGGGGGGTGSGGSGGFSACGSGNNGAQFAGGNGAAGIFICPVAGGGGGGGYYGGGGGGAALALLGGGGGGGSAYSAASAVGGITVGSASGALAASTSGQVTITYSQVTTATTLSASPASPQAAGTSVTFTAIVSPNDGGGTVEFKNGSSDISGCSAQPVTLVGANYQATCTTSSLPVGTNPITAVYSGDTNYLGSTSNLVSYRIIADTTTTLTSNHDPSYPGQSVTFTATVSPTDGGGSVTFTNTTTSVVLCNAVPLTLVGSNYQATCSTSSLPVGSNAISAVYTGDANYATSTGTLTQVVRKFPTDLSASIYFNAGQTFTVTATLTSLGHPVPVQTVSFSTGSHFLCNAITNGFGEARCVLNGSQTLLVEENGFTIAAEFPGSGAYYPSFATAVISMFP